MAPTTELMATLAQLLDRCAGTDDGRRALSMYDHVVQFTPLDGEPFYLDVHQGRPRVRPGWAPELPITETHEIKAESAVFAEWFAGRLRMIDAVETGRMFPTASHTTKRHIDHWLTKIIRTGTGRPALKDVY